MRLRRGVLGALLGVILIALGLAAERERRMHTQRDRSVLREVAHWRMAAKLLREREHCLEQVRLRTPYDRVERGRVCSSLGYTFTRWDLDNDDVYLFEDWQEEAAGHVSTADFLIRKAEALAGGRLAIERRMIWP
ncbi:hypothetical protein [Tautonia marina]|uniref:hypothetical protein n=1 Tax=Tautonia marina TaxID=2653855 RepID=UPI001260532C|nr:hypothetical protein [Tautonia marina]